MPRTRRRNVPGLVYHLISRFVDRDWFITKATERNCYLDLLGRAVERSDWRCLGYAVMSNHIHLAVVAGRDKLESWIRRVHSPFADWMNRTHDRIGTIFVRGPKEVFVPDRHVGRLLAYIHNNPVRAHVVEDAAASRWTSHRAYLGVEPAPSWLDVTLGLARARLPTRDAFRDLVGTAPAHPLGGDADETSDQALEQLVHAYEVAQLAEMRRPHPSRTVDPLVVVHLTADEVGVALAQVWSRRRSPREALVRSVVARCCERLGFTDVETAGALRLTPQAVSAIRRRGRQSAELAEITERVLVRVSRLADRVRAA